MKRAYKHEYNGWKNYQTWNVLLWVENDERNYNAMQEYLNSVARVPGKRANWKEAMAHCGLFFEKTGDNVSYIQTRLSYRSLDDALNERVEEIRESL